MKTNEPPAATKPTTFELAQLALTIQSQTQKRPERGFGDSINLALRLFDEADIARKHSEAAKQDMEAIFQTLFTATPSDWRKACDSYSQNYPERKGEIGTELEKRTYSRDRVVRELIRDKSLSSTTREKLFLGLAGFALTHKLPPYPGMSHEFWNQYEPVDRKMKRGERDFTGWSKTHEPIVAANLQPREWLEREMSCPMLRAKLCRWLVEARHAQLSVSRRRSIVPAKDFAARISRFDIQYKGKIRA